MSPSLCLLSSEDLRLLAGALRSGRVAPPFSSAQLRRYVPDRQADQIAAEFNRAVLDGVRPAVLADFLDVLVRDRTQRPAAEELIDLVWTGPEAAGIVNRETAVVVRELFQGARESVLIAGFAVYQGQTIFKTLAERMDQNPQLGVRMFLNIQRPLHDQSSDSELVRRFAERFARQEWPGRRFPEMYYDPRSLEADFARRASLHAKCVIVDDREAFVSSANFTEAAQTKNIEVGVLLRSPDFARRLSEHFETLASNHLVKPVPLSVFT